MVEFFPTPNSDGFRRGEKTNDLSLVGGTSKTLGLLVSNGIPKGVAYAPHHLRKLSKKSPSKYTERKVFVIEHGLLSEFRLFFNERN